MTVSLHQQIRVGAYVAKQTLMGREKYPLVLFLGTAVPLQPRLPRLRQDRLPSANPQQAPFGSRNALTRLMNAARRSSPCPAANR